MNMIYVLCNVETGDLLQVSESELISSGHPLQVRTIDMTMPDMTKCDWSHSTLSFFPKPSRSITKLDYLRRFTQAERIVIRTLAKTVPVIDDYVYLLELAESINLDDPDILTALLALEAQGVINAGRAQEILS